MSIEGGFVRLKIRKSKNGTYYVPSLSIKMLRLLSKKEVGEWWLSDDEKDIYLEAE